MFWKRRVQISPQMYEYSRPMIYFCRFSGYFPLTVQRVGLKIFLKWSPYYALYSFILGLLLITATCWELFEVYLVDKQQMMSPTDKITQVFAHGGWITIFFLGIFVSANQFLTFFAYIKLINEVDNIIKTTHIKSDKYLSIIMMVVAPTFAFLYGLNTWRTYMLWGLSTKEYLANNLGYYTLMGFTTTVFYSIRCLIHALEKRLSKLNKILELKNQNFRNVAKSISKESYGIFKVPTNAALKSQNGKIGDAIFKVFGVKEALKRLESNGVISYIKQTLKLLGFLFIFVRLFGDCFPKSNQALAYFTFSEHEILQLAKMYLKLCDAADLLNKLFSATMVIGIVIAFIQVVQPTYFFIAAVKKNTYPLAVLRSTLLGLFRNLTCVLLIIQSAYSCNMQVRTFALCLGLRKLEFSAWGLFTIDRFLFTSMIGSIIRFMMLLLQMQERERDNH